MKIAKIQKMDMYIKKICWYSRYIQCFSKILDNHISFSEDGLTPSEISNISYLLVILTKRLRQIILNMNSDWEFME